MFNSTNKVNEGILHCNYPIDHIYRTLKKVCCISYNNPTKILHHPSSKRLSTKFKLKCNFLTLVLCSYKLCPYKKKQRVVSNWLSPQVSNKFLPDPPKHSVVQVGEKFAKPLIFTMCCHFRTYCYIKWALD